MYAVTEELRRLIVRQAGRGHGPELTSTIAAGRAVGGQAGPRAVVVHGVYEGRAFRLEETGGRASRTLGRAGEAHVALDHDPYLSSSNSRIVRADGAWWLEDVAGNKNGTRLNWVYLERGGRVRLAQGDVIGVGRSVLVFYEA